MPRLAVALVHHPCVDKHGEIFTTSITNLDVHDIARSARSYGLDAFYVVTPLLAQQQMARQIISYWENEGVARNPDRRAALEVARVVGSIEEAIAAEHVAGGGTPLVVATSARVDPARAATTGELRIRLAQESALVLFGTGHGLAPSVLAVADVILEPLLGHARDGYNHLSVRSAAAIFIDRLRG